MLGVKQQRHVDGDAGKDRLLDRPVTRLGARDLDEDVRLGSAVEVGGLLDRRVGVVGEQRRDLERDAPVDTVGAFVDRREQLGGAVDVGEGDLEEELFAGEALGLQLGDLLVVGVAGADRVVEDRRVRGLPVSESSSM